MKRLLKRLFLGVEAPKNDFSTFFRHAPEAEKEKLLKEVVREANKDQKEIIEKYRKMFPKTN